MENGDKYRFPLVVFPTRTICQKPINGINEIHDPPNVHSQTSQSQ